MKKYSTLLSGILVSTILSSSPVLALEPMESNSTIVLTSSIESGAEQEALKRLNDYALTIYESEYFDTNINQNDKFILGSGFYQYFERNGQLEKSEVIVFPVYQDEKPIFTIEVTENENKWYSVAGTELTEELTETLTKPGRYIAKIYETQGVKTIELVDENQDLDGLEEIPVSSKAYGSTNKLVNNKISEVINAVQPLGIGFSTDLPSHKEIRMDNCLVIQPRQNGQVLGLCWASASGTIIRQQTGNRTIDAWQIANETGITPGTGVGIDVSRNVMINHGCTIQYQGVSRPAQNYTEVMHNVNNQYPIYMECVNLSQEVGHAVTLTGYDNSGNQQGLQYFDGAENAFKTTTYSGSNTTISSFGTSYRWDRSILIPLS